MPVADYTQVVAVGYMTGAFVVAAVVQIFENFVVVAEPALAAELFG